MSVWALTIAGSDSSGGAGIQADLRVFAAFDIRGASAVTAVTAQGPKGVTAVQLVEPEVLRQQIDAAFASYDISAVKIGMLGDVLQVKVVADALKRNQAIKIVLDPVLVSSSGTPLLSEEGRRAMVDLLLPMVDVITPNASELGALSGLPVRTEEERFAAARSLPIHRAAMVVVTGGDSNAKDLLIHEKAFPRSAQSPLILTEHTHGTGCVYSSAVAAALAKGRDVYGATGLAKEYINWALSSPIEAKRGRGYPNSYRSAAEMERRQWLSAGVHALRGVYVVTDAGLNPSLPPYRQASAAFAGGASTVQLREKGLTTPELIKLGRRMQSVAEGVGLFIVNDRVDIALACEADGVHLGPEDMPPKIARDLVGDIIIGCSVGSVEEADAVAEYVSYLAVGAIFGSSTKSDAGPPVGLELISKVKARHPGIPIVAIGGINLSNIASVAAAGADAAAVVSAVVCADNPVAATRALVAEFERGRAQTRPLRKPIEWPTVQPEELRERIERLFPSNERSTEEIFQHLEWEHKGELDHYRNRNWREVYQDIGELESLQDFNWLNSKGMVLFLPAFMVMLLERQREMADELLEKLCEEESSEPRISALMSKPQRRTIADFLAWLRSEIDDDDPSSGLVDQAYAAFADEAQPES